MKVKTTQMDLSENPSTSKTSFLTVKGEKVQCECGCNLFTKHKNLTDDGWEIYTCNACNGVVETNH